ncbi:hypothetical protein NMF47_18395, partial [Serratia nevei]|nr:hypothetical protein [Serratia nevei]
QQIVREQYLIPQVAGGVFLIGVLKNGLNLIGVSSYFMNVVIGLVIVAAITVTHYKKRKETDVGFA